jgi:hypothetical protein
VVAAACGAGPGGPTASTASGRESGQSRLIEKTFAGRDRCNPQDHTRPFVIEWDGTDISSFESRATTDVVFVRYEGCKLQVLDACANDSVRGSLGSYGAVDWTSGSVEKVDILDENELYAKLPLGTSDLGARVAGGERFHMEYFVAGTRKATRPAVYRSDVDAVPGCLGATHFVYAYNVGAFALGSYAKLGTAVGATVWGVGAGASQKNQSAIEKQGGVLASCRGESATEVSTCKVPIRLALREIEPGDAPEKKAEAAPETPQAANLAGKLARDDARSHEATERLASAQRKLSARDGKGCLAELDAHDRLEKRAGRLSTDATGLGYLRAECLMLAGQCNAGKGLARKSTEARNPDQSASQIDRSVDDDVAYFCGAAATEPRDQLLVALRVLDEGAMRQRTTPKVCLAAVDAGVTALPKVKPRGESDERVKGAARRLAEDGTKCLARAGDCPTAWKRFPALQASWGKQDHIEWKSSPEAIRSSFETATYGECVGKEPGPLKPVEELARSVHELDWAAGHGTTTVTAALCSDLTTRARRAQASLREDRSDFVKSSERNLREVGTKCLVKANDCATARAFFLASFRQEYPKEMALRGEDEFGKLWDNRCEASLVPGLTDEDALAQALRVLSRAGGRNDACGPAFDALKSAVASLRDPSREKRRAKPVRVAELMKEAAPTRST